MPTFFWCPFSKKCKSHTVSPSPSERKARDKPELVLPRRAVSAALGEANSHSAADRSEHSSYEDHLSTKAQFGQREKQWGAMCSGSQAPSRHCVLQDQPHSAQRER